MGLKCTTRRHGSRGRRGHRKNMARAASESGVVCGVMMLAPCMVGFKVQPGDVAKHSGHVPRGIRLLEPVAM